MSARRRGPRPAARVLVVAGLDPSGGAGLVADLDAVRAAGADAWLVAAALTAQGPGGARGFEAATEGFVLDQIDALVEGRERAGAVKTGMMGSALNAAAVAARLAEPPLARTPLVVDPVLAASSGASLFDPEGAAVGDAFAPLLSRCRVATPNLPELAALTGLDVSTDEGAVRAARALPARAVLVKGGHRRGAPEDLLVEGRRVTRLAGRRRPGSARGTGCRLASALAAFLARGMALEEAARRAKRLVERYLDG
ncbi:MAG TPA: bifunctional hydroxymethylpyrimidine kinase/phosphomethylpyrimidine kinase [Anaeromyxobacteraceae bacterium]|nr:bifunctional hydroxymethylpyrimidine kinase/phosphomethylpyrimidine kinase [Anaeromyxobacteraceae bacterium]